ncbi:Maf family nucleotide pyrophosphatase [Candidatus Endowatersipora endosymbiont of Watersipora subatra]|uniref:Maf family nucleotide pyrophosphatase n=1 Tax=Candidatus Endowatersipora endosymbiont of Watersipora subatra TaxID=3077946 RepID=UPI00312C7CA3
MVLRSQLVLASQSTERISLLQQVGLQPDMLYPTDINRNPSKKETASSLAKRLSKTKSEIAIESLKKLGYTGKFYILSADTVVSVGSRILPQTEVLDEAARYLRLLSGRAHRVYTGLTLYTPKKTFRHKLVETRIGFKKLSDNEFNNYLISGEWQGQAGGYSIQGIAGAFVIKLTGSYSNVVGLPLYETCSLLIGEGYPIQSNWRVMNHKLNNHEKS